MIVAWTDRINWSQLTGSQDVVSLRLAGGSTEPLWRIHFPPFLSVILSALCSLMVARRLLYFPVSQIVKALKEMGRIKRKGYCLFVCFVLLFWYFSFWKRTFSNFYGYLIGLWWLQGSLDMMAFVAGHNSVPNKIGTLFLRNRKEWKGNWQGQPCCLTGQSWNFCYKYLNISSLLHSV